MPVTLADLHRDATRASDRVEMFRTYVKLLNHAYKALEKARKEAENADRRLGELRVDHTFFLRHRARVETAFRTLIDTYRNPTTARRPPEHPIAHYTVRSAFEVGQPVH